jgi:hypothetical protein
MSEANHMECGTLVPPFHDKLACQLYEEQAPLGKAVTSYSTPRSGETPDVKVKTQEIKN